MERNTIAVGIRELKRRGRRAALDRDRVRRPGGGRKRLTELRPLGDAIQGDEEKRSGDRA